MPNKIKDLYFLFVLLFSGLSTAFSRSHIGLVILFIVGVVVFSNKLTKPPKTLLWAFGIWIGYFVINTIIMKSFHSFFMITYIIKIIIAWWLLDHYREQIFLKYENILYMLAVVSLFFWTWQFVSFSSLNQFMSFFEIGGLSSKSILVYSLHHSYLPGEIPRNCGFTWEPGPFSGFIIIAMFINLARHGVTFKNKQRMIIFTFTLLTTQSTTGYVGLLALIFWYAWSHNYHNIYFRFLSVPLILVLIFYLFTSIPFLKEKIIKESQQDVTQIIDHSIKSNVSQAPGRFASLQLCWEDFKNYPLAGYGGQSAARYGYQYGGEVAAISGIGTIMGRYGIIGLSLFLFLIFKSGKWLASNYNFTGYLIFPALILIIAFGFGIIETPIFVTLWMIPVFLKNNLTKNCV